MQIVVPMYVIRGSIFGVADSVRWDAKPWFVTWLEGCFGGGWGVPYTSVTVVEWVARQLSPQAFIHTQKKRKKTDVKRCLKGSLRFERPFTHAR